MKRSFRGLDWKTIPDQPEWLSCVNASVLKVKLAMAIIGISSTHLPKTFIAAGSLQGLPFCSPDVRAGMDMEQAVNVGTAMKCSTLTTVGVMWQTIIHGGVHRLRHRHRVDRSHHAGRRGAG